MITSTAKSQRRKLLSEDERTKLITEILNKNLPEEALQWSPTKVRSQLERLSQKKLDLAILSGKVPFPASTSSRAPRRSRLTKSDLEILTGKKAFPRPAEVSSRTRRRPKILTRRDLDILTGKVPFPQPRETVPPSLSAQELNLLQGKVPFTNIQPREKETRDIFDIRLTNKQGSKLNILHNNFSSVERQRAAAKSLNRHANVMISETVSGKIQFFKSAGKTVAQLTFSAAVSAGANTFLGGFPGVVLAGATMSLVMAIKNREFVGIDPKTGEEIWNIYGTVKNALWSGVTSGVTSLATGGLTGPISEYIGPSKVKQFGGQVVGTFIGQYTGNKFVGQLRALVSDPEDKVNPTAKMRGRVNAKLGVAVRRQKDADRRRRRQQSKKQRQEKQAAKELEPINAHKGIKILGAAAAAVAINLAVYSMQAELGVDLETNPFIKALKNRLQQGSFAEAVGVPINMLNSMAREFTEKAVLKEEARMNAKVDPETYARISDTARRYLWYKIWMRRIAMSSLELSGNVAAGQLASQAKGVYDKIQLDSAEQAQLAQAVANLEAQQNIQDVMDNIETNSLEAALNLNPLAESIAKGLSPTIAGQLNAVNDLLFSTKESRAERRALEENLTEVRAQKEQFAESAQVQADILHKSQAVMKEVDRVADILIDRVDLDLDDKTKLQEMQKMKTTLKKDLKAFSAESNASLFVDQKLTEKSLEQTRAKSLGAWTMEQAGTTLLTGGLGGVPAAAARNLNKLKLGAEMLNKAGLAGEVGAGGYQTYQELKGEDSSWAASAASYFSYVGKESDKILNWFGQAAEVKKTIDKNIEDASGIDTDSVSLLINAFSLTGYDSQELLGSRGEVIRDVLLGDSAVISTLFNKLRITSELTTSQKTARNMARVALIQVLGENQKAEDNRTANEAFSEMMDMNVLKTAASDTITAIEDQLYSIDTRIGTTFKFAKWVTKDISSQIFTTQNLVTGLIGAKAVRADESLKLMQQWVVNKQIWQAADRKGRIAQQRLKDIEKESQPAEEEEEEEKLEQKRPERASIEEEYERKVEEEEEKAPQASSLDDFAEAVQFGGIPDDPAPRPATADEVEAQSVLNKVLKELMRLPGHAKSSLKRLKEIYRYINTKIEEVRNSLLWGLLATVVENVFTLGKFTYKLVSKKKNITTETVNAKVEADRRELAEKADQPLTAESSSLVRETAPESWVYRLAWGLVTSLSTSTSKEEETKQKKKTKKTQKKQPLSRKPITTSTTQVSAQQAVVPARVQGRPVEERLRALKFSVEPPNFNKVATLNFKGKLFTELKRRADNPDQFLDFKDLFQSVFKEIRRDELEALYPKMMTSKAKAIGTSANIFKKGITNSKLWRTYYEGRVTTLLNRKLNKEEKAALVFTDLLQRLNLHEDPMYSHFTTLSQRLFEEGFRWEK